MQFAQEFPDVEIVSAACDQIVLVRFPDPFLEKN
jgi:hypothetical protein